MTRSLFLTAFVCSVASAAPATWSRMPVPDGWKRPAELDVGDAFEGATTAQARLALEVVNTEVCSCSCARETLAVCRVRDTGCPVAKKLVRRAAQLAVAGWSKADIVLAIKDIGEYRKTGPWREVVAHAGQPLVESDVRTVPKVSIVVFGDLADTDTRTQLEAIVAARAMLEAAQPSSGIDIRLRHLASSPDEDMDEFPRLALAQHALGGTDFLAFVRTIKPDIAIKELLLAKKVPKKKALDAMYAKAVDAQIERDAEAAVTLGVERGAVTTFINGRRIVGAFFAQALLGVMERELAHADALLARKVPSDKLQTAIADEIRGDALR